MVISSMSITTSFHVLQAFTGTPSKRNFIMTKVSNVVQKLIMSLKMVPTYSIKLLALYRFVDMLFVLPPKLSVQHSISYADLRRRK